MEIDWKCRNIQSDVKLDQCASTTTFTFIVNYNILYWNTGIKPTMQ